MSKQIVDPQFLSWSNFVAMSEGSHNVCTHTGLFFQCRSFHRPYRYLDYVGLESTHRKVTVARKQSDSSLMLASFEASVSMYPSTLIISNDTLQVGRGFKPRDINPNKMPPILCVTLGTCRNQNSLALA